ncbi:MAG TPA: NUDIX domain-containing protein [Pseudolabrys sp.]|nr:NUDIX domain-containing protein [Pseudolabrys sp.]
MDHILAAGGIVVRNDPHPRIGIVQLRRNKAWVLPKGKLNGNESALAAARREVWEETGHAVAVHEFVGALSYKSRGLPKVVQFWRMQAEPAPSRALMRDVRAVEWLPLDEAVERLSRVHERVFLANIGPMVLRAARAKDRALKAARIAAPPRRPAGRARVAAGKPSELPAIESAMEVMVDAAVDAAPLYDPMPSAREPIEHAAPPARAHRPWLQRHVLDRLFGKAGADAARP